MSEEQSIGVYGPNEEPARDYDANPPKMGEVMGCGCRYGDPMCAVFNVEGHCVGNG